MNQDKMRAEFEEFCKSINISHQMSHGQYHSEKTSTYWWIWKSSRESMTVELPDSLFQLIEYCPSIDGNSDVEILHIDTSTKINVSEYLESQGIKVITK